jgi:hypothetical protein
MRSGYLHPEPKYGFVVSGEVEVWVLTNQGTDKKVRDELVLGDAFALWRGRTIKTEISFWICITEII